MLSYAVVSSILLLACWIALRAFDYEGATFSRKGLSEDFLPDRRMRILSTKIGFWLFAVLTAFFWVLALLERIF
jgi:hypothetical protein